MLNIFTFGLGDTVVPNIETQGGKGAGLVEMTNMGYPVPEGFGIGTSVCMEYLSGFTQDDGDLILAQVLKNVQAINLICGENANGNLFSIRSGAKFSMPGMMDTILNVGMTDSSLPYWENKIGQSAAHDSYCRLLCMMGETAYDVPKEQLSDYYRANKGVIPYPNIMQNLIVALIERGVPSFWNDVNLQYAAAIQAVWKSWNSSRAIEYRNIHGYSHDAGTAVIIQRMVFGNLNNNSWSGVLFTRNPDNGRKVIMGEYLLNAQGEDVVSGTVTPSPLEDLKLKIPTAYTELISKATELELHRKDMQDIEFTIEDGKLYMLQVRTGKRTSNAAFKIAYDLYSEKVITHKVAVSRCSYSDYLTVQRIQVNYKTSPTPDYTGIGASLGVVKGKITNSPKLVIKHPKTYILIRKETTPDDFEAMIHAKAIVTLTGGITSHAAVVARGLSIPCIVGCKDLDIGMSGIQNTLANEKIAYGSMVTIDGSTGAMWMDKTIKVTKGSSPEAESLLKPLLHLDVEPHLVYLSTFKGHYADLPPTTILVADDGLVGLKDLFTQTEDTELSFKVSLNDSPNVLGDDVDMTAFNTLTGTKALFRDVLIAMLNTFPSRAKYISFITSCGICQAIIKDRGYKLVTCATSISAIMKLKNPSMIDLGLSPMDTKAIIKMAELAGKDIWDATSLKSKGTLVKEILS